MKYILDSDTIIYFLRGNQDIVSQVAVIDISKLCTTVINQAELLYGVYNSINVKSNMKTITGFLSNIEILNFESEAAKIFGKLKASLRSEGQLIADMDLMIASIAIEKRTGSSEETNAESNGKKDEDGI